MEISEELLDRIAQRLKAMGNPTRLRILHALEDGELSVSEIVDAVDGSQAVPSSIGMCVAVMFIMKIVGANMMRLVLNVTERRAKTEVQHG